MYRRWPGHRRRGRGPLRRQGPPSYLRRQGHLTKAQRRALREHWPEWGLAWTHGEHLDLDTAFGRDAPKVLEVGCGDGEALFAYARAFPEHDIVGIEMHKPALGTVLQRLRDAPLPNVRLLRGDALVLLAGFVAPASLTAVHLFFPDPWPTSPERRWVRPRTLADLGRALRPGGHLHWATDVQAYAEHVQQVAEPCGWSPTPIAAGWRPLTRYEHRGQQAGRQIFEGGLTLKVLPS